MKYFLVILAMFILTGCSTQISSPPVVTSVEATGWQAPGAYQYKVFLQTESFSGSSFFYSDSLYKVGDLLK